MTDSQKLDLIIDILGGPGAESEGTEVFIAERKMDNLGRITIPKSVRTELGIDDSTTIKIYRGKNKIIIKKD